MRKALLAIIITVFMGYLGTVLGHEVIGNFREFGPIAAIATMGGFIIYFNNKKE